MVTVCALPYVPAAGDTVGVAVEDAKPIAGTHDIKQRTATARTGDITFLAPFMRDTGVFILNLIFHPAIPQLQMLDAKLSDFPYHHSRYWNGGSRCGQNIDATRFRYRTSNGVRGAISDKGLSSQ